MKTETQLRKTIMRRVWAIYAMRKLMAPEVRFVAFAAIMAAIVSSVSLPNIIANALRTSDIVTFSLAALSNTTLYIQLGVLTAGLIIIGTLYEAIRPREMQIS
jgi:hypothetical protein